MICKNFRELEKELRQKIDYVLLTDVTQIVSEVMLDHIAYDVYDAYEPTLYERRYNDKGLLDPNNIVSSVVGDKLIVENYTLGNPHFNGVSSKNAGKPIAGIIESGLGYDSNFQIKRPFLKNTRYDLFTNKYHVMALRQGLKKQGLEVK